MIWHEKKSCAEYCTAQRDPTRKVRSMIDTSANLVRLDNVDMHYGRGKTAVQAIDDVSLTIARANSSLSSGPPVAASPR